MGRSLGDAGEHAWLARLGRRLARGPRDPQVLVGSGDDAAVLRPSRRPLVVTTDALVENVHFRHGWYGAPALGARAFAVNASDLAAMGARPTAAVMAIACRRDAPLHLLDGIVGGFTRAARRHGVALVGGNLSAACELSVTVTLFGRLPGRVSRRRGARPGDLLLVSGTVGAMGAAVQARLAGTATRLPSVPDRVDLGIGLASVAHAMIDVSDGLVQDLGHLARASGVVAEIDLAAVPIAARCREAFGPAAAVAAVTAGEDYELLVAVPPRQLARARAVAARQRCRLTVIGRVLAGRPSVRVRDAHGRIVRVSRNGFDHFRRPARYGR